MTAGDMLRSRMRGLRSTSRALSLCASLAPLLSLALAWWLSASALPALMWAAAGGLWAAAAGPVLRGPSDALRTGALSRRGRAAGSASARYDASAWCWSARSALLGGAIYPLYLLLDPARAVDYRRAAVRHGHAVPARPSLRLRRRTASRQPPLDTIEQRSSLGRAARQPGHRRDGDMGQRRRPAGQNRSCGRSCAASGSEPRGAHRRAGAQRQRAARAHARAARPRGGPARDHQHAQPR